MGRYVIKFEGRGILLDIEGTTSSISFVYDVMFPYARRELGRFLDECWDKADVAEACELIAQDAGHDSLGNWSEATSTEDRRQLVRDEVIRLMDDDVKATGLKQLQGLIWRSGFESGEMRAHVYDDVPPAIRAWNQAGKDVRIYSSGSIAAQKLFFGHTIVGDLLDQFRGHYDTTTGPKKDQDSYGAIAKAFGLPAEAILFVSDVPDELNAARAAGMQTALCIRPGNAEVTQKGHPAIQSFAEIAIAQ